MGTNGSNPEVDSTIEFLSAIAVVANSASPVERALPEALTQICRFTGWPVAHAYVVSANGADPTRLWHVDDPSRFAPFREMSESIAFADGKGLVGKVLAARAPVWIEDLAREPQFLRAAVAEAAGLRCGLAFPVLVGPDVAAVLELFTTQPCERDNDLLRLVRTVGIQLGRMLERARATEFVRVANERYELLFESASDAIILGDIAGAIETANPAACRLLGYDRSELLGRNARQFAAPEWLDVLDRRVDGKTRGSEPEETYDMVMVDRAGNRIPVEVTSWAVRDGAAVTGICALICDLRDRQRAESALRESEARFRGAFEAAPIGMALAALDGRWLMVNHRLCGLIGYGEDELLKMRFQEITHPDDLAADVAFGERMLRGDFSSYQMEKRYIRKDGSVVWIHLSVSLVRDESGAAAYSVAQIMDIDDRKRRELGVIDLRSRHPGASGLSPREREVLGLLALGKTSAEVGVELGVAEETVQTHVRRSMAKLGARSRTQAVASAIRLGGLGDGGSVAPSTSQL